MAASLPDDLLLEILVRINDEASLFRSATACKQWRRLITDRSFLRRRWPEHSPSSFVGFFAQGNRHDQELDAGSLPGPEPCFIPARRSALGARRRPLGSFVAPAAHAGLFDGASPLVSRHGLVVVRLEAHDKTVFQLGVCDLHAAACVVLPPLKVSPNFYDYDCNGYAILTGADCRSKDEESAPTVLPMSNPLSFFKVAVIGYTNDDLRYSLHTFSSGKSCWDEPSTNCFDGDAQSYDYGSFSDAVVRNGWAHWLFDNYGEGCLQVVNLDAKTGHVSLTKLPFKPTGPSSCLTLGTDGVLSLLWIQKEGPQLEIWEQREEQGNMSSASEWVCARTIVLKQLENENGTRDLIGLREKCGALIIADNYRQIYTADLETGMMEKVVDWPSRRSMCHWDSMPLEIDWPMVFVSGLTK